MDLLFEKLKEKNLTISYAESITGGLLSSNLTLNAGSSKVFKGSIIAYSNEVKEQVLKIPRDTITKNSVVSPEVSNLMVGKGLVP